MLGLGRLVRLNEALLFWSRLGIAKASRNTKMQRKDFQIQSLFLLMRYA